MVMVPSANGPVLSPDNSKLELLQYIVSLLGRQPLLQVTSERLPLSNEGHWRMRTGVSGHGGRGSTCYPGGFLGQALPHLHC